MERLVNTVLELLEQSDGYWITDNCAIDTDNIMAWKEDESLEIFDCNNDKQLHIKFNEIIGICFDYVQGMIVTIIKIKNNPSILIHNLYFN